jgi:hypothetical protein
MAKAKTEVVQTEEKTTPTASKTLSTSAVTVQDISPKTKQEPWVNPANVTFNVEYSKDYKGPKHMPEGPVVVSHETAEHFEKLGIGSVVK